MVGSEASKQVGCTQTGGWLYSQYGTEVLVDFLCYFSLNYRNCVRSYMEELLRCKFTQLRFLFFLGKNIKSQIKSEIITFSSSDLYKRTRVF